MLYFLSGSFNQLLYGRLKIFLLNILKWHAFERRTESIQKYIAHNVYGNCFLVLKSVFLVCFACFDRSRKCVFTGRNRAVVTGCKSAIGIVGFVEIQSYAVILYI